MPDEVRGDQREVRFERVSPVRAYERIVEQVEEAIFTGQLRPGQHLPSERDLMIQFGVGRSSVREALRVLQSNGMVRSRPGDPRGPEVLAPSTEPLLQSMTRLARTDALSLGELVQFRMVLESTANLLAARLRTDEHLTELAAALAAMRASAERGTPECGPTGFSRAEAAFRDAVTRASGNALLRVCAAVVRDVVATLLADSPAGADDQRALARAALHHHTAVFEAIRAGDGDTAARLARRGLHEHYARHLPPEQRPMLLPLLDHRPTAGEAPDGDATGA
ncbi:FadR/GntR family transcriptional regulator [Goodfellowiella coeruleoviolacea]|uniref:DNA-binding transcriptional regulator, FadR family n=1 Tax=Goodfellowiella coeruleoviolacea TaxID=334858 RepID=A0AAE3GG72_9PSEU|nr:GntR family transcriptional regulator [Goodfellowiella coeruleoviolacea]MCP2166724.1 DNA-binding transcriptional regulator, FadR family [Goodfellowiella coeruleoviolacea]